MSTKLKLSLIVSLTLGLMPFSEPHIWGKLKWIIGGAHGMQLLDWFDTLLHGTPWLLFIYFLIESFISKSKVK